MKVVVDCECIMMQRSLELFLEKYLDNFENANVVVSDTKKECDKPLFFINENSPYLNLPFGKDELLYALEEFSFAVKNSYVAEDNETLESKISSLCNDFRDRLINVIKEHYE